MAETVTLDLPEQVIESARAIASRTDRRLEDVLVEWIDRVAGELPVESLPDEDLLRVAEMQLSAEIQGELDELLIINRESTLEASQHERLDHLMQIYRRGLVRKARALKVAVERGLMAPLS